MIFTVVMQSLIVSSCILFFFLNQKYWQKAREIKKHQVIIKILVSCSGVVTFIVAAIIIITLVAACLKMFNAPFFVNGMTLKLAALLIYIISSCLSVVFFFRQYGIKSIYIDVVYIPLMYFILNDKSLFLLLYPVTCGILGDCI